MQIIKFSNVEIEKSHQEEVVSFLFEHLQEFGDSKEDISKSIDYISDFAKGKGGHLLLAKDGGTLVGAVIVNQTGMDGYIPANILVYIASHKDYRGKGIGRRLMEETIKVCKGGIALHCEPENPARKLYEKLGFTSKYLEMRLNS